MTRAELIRRFVLDSICDDFEDIEQIDKWVTKQATECGFTVSRDEIIQALRELISEGYASAWDLRRPSNQDTPHDEIEPLNPGFSRTKVGVAFTSDKSDETLRSFILGSFRGFTHIRLADIERWWKERYGNTIPREGVIRDLRELVALGYLTAGYKDKGGKYDGMPPIEEIKPFGAYFWVTGAGYDFLESDESWWPFEPDDDGDWKLRKDWSAPTS